MPRRINLQEDEYQKLGTVEEFFNVISDRRFVATVDYLTRGIGAGIDDAVCTFPGDLDEYDVAEMGHVPEGIMFSLFEEEVVIDVPTFRYFLNLACAAYVRDHPEDRAKIEELLARPQPPLTPPGTNISYNAEASPAT